MLLLVSAVPCKHSTSLLTLATSCLSSTGWLGAAIAKAKGHRLRACCLRMRSNQRPKQLHSSFFVYVAKEVGKTWALSAQPLILLRGMLIFSWIQV